MKTDKPTLDLSNKIRLFREIKGLSQEAIATQLGISQQAYQKIENGTTRLDLERANLIAQELNLELDFLLNFNLANYWYNCTLSGNETNNTNIPPELISAYERQIESLKNEIEFLRKLITKD